jgi:hypothetical protein
MRNVAIAEWILCRLISNERAASIVGDLVEIGERKGALWFWLSFAGVVFSSLWRRSLAFIAALYAGTWTFSEFIATADSIYSKHYPTGGWNLAFGPLIFTGSTVWAVFFYAAIRYGFLDRTMQLAFVWAGLFTTVICFWWQPAMLAVCIAAAFFVVLGSISNSGFRMEALAVLVSVVGGSAVRFLAIMLAGWPLSVFPGAPVTYPLGRSGNAGASFDWLGEPVHGPPFLLGGDFDLVAQPQLGDVASKARIGSGRPSERDLLKSRRFANSVLSHGYRVPGSNPPAIKRRQRTLALDAMTLLLVANLAARFVIERLQQIEGDVGRLEAFGVGVRDVVNQRTQCS